MWEEVYYFLEATVGTEVDEVLYALCCVRPALMESPQSPPRRIIAGMSSSTSCASV